jgi:hypothetical protein
MTAHPAGERDGLARHRAVALSDLARMQRVAGAVERADRDGAIREASQKVGARRGAVEQPVEFEMRRP